jgi:hypothetical protein
MAVYLRYDRVREDSEVVEYEVRGAEGTAVYRLPIPKRDPSQAAMPEGLSPALGHKVIGRAVRALETEGSWPAGGLIQS